MCVQRRSLHIERASGGTSPTAATTVRGREASVPLACPCLKEIARFCGMTAVAFPGWLAPLLFQALGREGPHCSLDLAPQSLFLQARGRNNIFWSPGLPWIGFGQACGRRALLRPARCARQPLHQDVAPQGPALKSERVRQQARRLKPESSPSGPDGACRWGRRLAMSFCSSRRGEFGDFNPRRNAPMARQSSSVATSAETEFCHSGCG